MRIYNPPRTAVISTTRPKINVETINSDKQLENTSAEIHVLTNLSMVSLNVFSPSVPILGINFVLINESVSTGNIYINNTNVLPGDRYEIVWQGDRWLEL